MKAIIVDDESRARNILERLLFKSDATIEIIGKYGNLQEAVIAINKLNPDVVFLDVQMPHYAGYEISSFIPGIDFEIIFITAFDQYAIKAFELSAIDYILKPINRNRLSQSLEKLSKRMEEKDNVNHYNVLLDNLKNENAQKIIISEVGKKRIIDLADILAIEAKSSYSKLHLVDGKILVVSKNLKHLESVLPEDDTFFRSHKSWIVAVKHITEYNSKEGYLKIDDRIISKISKYRLAEFKAIMPEIID